MRTCARLACALTLIATPAAAQSTTEDGIRAMLRGDYAAATRILRPLADNAARPDPVAQFFLAILYDTGHPGNNARACRLFLSVAARANPFSEQATALATSIREEFGNGASLLCGTEEGWQGGPPQTFDLGPGHQIVFADTSVRVLYRDREVETNLVLPPGAAFLPIQHTPLAVTRPIAARRHFFQWFAWMPDTTLNPSSWTLWWTLSEVVDGDWIALAHEGSLAVVRSSAPPPSYDVSKLVRLRVNTSGEAELTIVSGSAPRTEVIPWHGGR